MPGELEGMNFLVFGLRATFTIIMDLFNLHRPTSLLFSTKEKKEWPLHVTAVLATDPY